MSDKTTKQIKWHVHPVWSVFAVHMKKAWVLSYPFSAHRRFWSDWADADQSLRWTHSHFVGFVMRRLISTWFKKPETGLFFLFFFLKIKIHLCPSSHNEASDQGLHCIITGISIQIKIKMKNKTRHSLNEKRTWYGWHSPLAKEGVTFCFIWQFSVLSDRVGRTWTRWNGTESRCYTGYKRRENRMLSNTRLCWNTFRWRVLS